MGFDHGITRNFFGGAIWLSIAVKIHWFTQFRPERILVAKTSNGLSSARFERAPSVASKGELAATEVKSPYLSIDAHANYVNECKVQYYMHICIYSYMYIICIIFRSFRFHVEKTLFCSIARTEPQNSTLQLSTLSRFQWFPYFDVCWLRSSSPRL